MKAVFYGGPYDGKECDLPFLPELLIGETMDGDWGTKAEKGLHFDFRISTYIYQLKLPGADGDAFEYRFRLDRPQGLSEWIGGS